MTTEEKAFMAVVDATMVLEVKMHAVANIYYDPNKRMQHGYINTLPRPLLPVMPEQATAIDAEKVALAILLKAVHQLWCAHNGDKPMVLI